MWRACQTPRHILRGCNVLGTQRWFVTSNNDRLGFIGGGKMAEAIICGVVANRVVPPSQIVVADPNPARRTHLQELAGVQVTECNKEAVENADFIVFANKPQHCAQVFRDVKGCISTDALVLSICAGVTVSKFQEGLQHERVVRTMPNTPAMVQAAMTVWYATDTVTAEQLEATKKLLNSFGKEEQVMDEDYMDMATALVGTGPAYVFLLMESVVDAGVHMGFPRDVADRLVRQTVLGSAQYASDAAEKHATSLRNDITSPGGTTASALYAADRGNFRTVISDAVWSAFERSKALNHSADLNANERPISP